MKIVLASSEIAPFVKTGGLADVTGSLPKYINADEFNVIAIMPLYTGIEREAFTLEYICRIDIPHSGGTADAVLFRSVLPGSAVTVYFIEYKEYFNRDGIYGTGNNEYADNDSRFSLFCRGVLETCKAINFMPAVIHCNDWQTGLIPVYLRTLYHDDNFFSRTSVLFTIHNLSYRGLFDPEHTIRSSGLPWEVYSMYGLEFYGKFSFLKGGIYYSGLINTVSPGYSREIQTVEYGEGLDGLLRSRCRSLTGIINGVDYEVWNSETDPLIKKNYSSADIENKRNNTAELCRLCGLNYTENIPVIGMITRLTEQKGIDLVAAVMDDLMKKNLRFVLLGTGAEHFHSIFSWFAEKYPGRIFVSLKYDNKLSHMIYAGSDLFLMPSRFEPCGLSQLISMKYGTIPLVRATGGLADTVIPFNANEKMNDEINGFSFTRYSCDALLECLESALNMYKNRQEWQRLMRNTMKCDFSWRVSALKYEELYRELHAMKQDSLK